MIENLLIYFFQYGPFGCGVGGGGISGSKSGVRRKRAKAGGHVGSHRSEFDPFFYKLLSWIIIWGFVAVAQPFPIIFLSG